MKKKEKQSSRIVDRKKTEEGVLGKERKGPVRQAITSRKRPDRVRQGSKNQRGVQGFRSVDNQNNIGAPAKKKSFSPIEGEGRVERGRAAIRNKEV